MSKKLLVTFGCSWTYGIGVGYQSGMSEFDYKQIVKNDNLGPDQLSFRALLSKKYDLVNKNFSCAGSSNAKQFRLAKIFFSSDEFCQSCLEYDKIIVLWGITSTARNELYDLVNDKFENFLYHKTKLGKLLLKYSYNHDHEIQMLSIEMEHWNHYFKELGITNFWFDTFNHHNYKKFSGENNKQLRETYKLCAGPNWPSWEDYREQNFEGLPAQIQQEILNVDRFEFAKLAVLALENAKRNKDHLILYDANPRDLLSQLVMEQGSIEVDKKYHYSMWNLDTDRIKILTQAGVLNPISHHPTRLGHELLTEFFVKNIGKFLI